MLTATCPDCGIQLSLEESWLGKQVTCGSCCNSFSLSANLESKTQSSLTEDFPSSLRAPVPLYKQKRRRKSFLVRAISLTIHFFITCASVYVGYRVVMSRRALPPKQVAVRQELPKKVIPPKPLMRARPENPIQPAEEPTRKPKPETHIPTEMPFKDATDYVTLSPLDHKARQVLLADMGGTEFVFSTNTESLTHTNKVLEWRSAENEKPTVIAGLTILDGALQFIWVEEVPEDAVAAVWNSVVFLKAKGIEHTVSLRAPSEVEPLSIDLTKALQRIPCKCEFLPHLDEIYFELTGIARFPANNRTGMLPLKIKLRESLDIRYTGAQNAGTTVAMKRKGNIVVVELSSLYTLPSGDNEPMSIPAGNRKMKELSEIEAEAKWSKTNVGNMKSSLSSAKTEFAAIQRRNAGLNTAAAAAKSLALGELAAEIRSRELAINRATQLIQNLPAIGTEIRELDRVSAVARELHGTKGIEYRFFTIVNGIEVDLVVAKLQ
ncbi:MAG: hypothetical protein GXP26_07480 [Planctomycetes bacterium]|nr:hypothetical protein [Planctomycetota bacterium]